MQLCTTLGDSGVINIIIIIIISSKPQDGAQLSPRIHSNQWCDARNSRYFQGIQLLPNF